MLLTHGQGRGRRLSRRKTDDGGGPSGAWRPAVSRGDATVAVTLGEMLRLALMSPPPPCFYQGAVSGRFISAEMGSKTGAGASTAERRSGETESSGSSAQ